MPLIGLLNWREQRGMRFLLEHKEQKKESAQHWLQAITGLSHRIPPLGIVFQLRLGIGHSLIDEDYPMLQSRGTAYAQQWQSRWQRCRYSASLPR